MQFFWTNTRLKAYARQLEGFIRGQRVRHKEALREMVGNVRVLAEDKKALTQALAVLGAYLKNVEAGRDALQKSCGDTLEELRALRKLEVAVRGYSHVDGQPKYFNEVWACLGALDTLRKPKP